MDVFVTDAARRAYEAISRQSDALELDDALIERGLRALNREDSVPELLETEDDVFCQLIAIQAGSQHLLATAASLHRRLEEAAVLREAEEARVEALQVEFRRLQMRAGARDRSLLDLRRDDEHG